MTPTSASVRASGSASVMAYDSASVEASDSASVEASAESTVVSWKGRAGIKLQDRAVCIVRDWGTKAEVMTADGDLVPAKPKAKRITRKPRRGE